MSVLTLALALAPRAAEEGEGGWTPLTFDPGTFFWTAAVFVVVVYLLAKFAWNPLLAALEKREGVVAGSLKEADAARLEARRLSAEFDQKVRAAHAEASRIAEEARASAEKLSAELEAAARARVERLMERAREEVGLAQRQAVEELRAHAVNLALAATSTLLQENVDEEGNRRLASSVIESIDKQRARS